MRKLLIIRLQMRYRHRRRRISVVKAYMYVRLGLYTFVVHTAMTPTILHYSFASAKLTSLCFSKLLRQHGCLLYAYMGLEFS